MIDALDEVARIGEEKINEIIVKARASTATTVIFASRSYVWDQARTTAVRDCFGVEPTILRLEPFDDDERRQLFADYLPSKTSRRSEPRRPFRAHAHPRQSAFLKLFADAYVQGGRRFSSKNRFTQMRYAGLPASQVTPRERRLVRRSTLSSRQPAKSSPNCFFLALWAFSQRRNRGRCLSLSP